MSLLKFTLVGAFFFTLSSVCYSQSFPEVVKFVAPPYPAVAVAVRAEGEVRISAEVDSSGRVASVTAYSGHVLLRKASEIAAKQWSFTAKDGLHFLTLVFVFKIGKSKNAVRFGQYGLKIYTAEPLIETSVVY